MLPDNNSSTNNLQGNTSTLQPNESGNLQGASTTEQFKSADSSSQPLSIATDAPFQTLSNTQTQPSKPAPAVAKKVSTPLLYLTGLIVIVVYIVMQIMGLKKPKTAKK